ncbi:MAG TPA: immune inhibitor A domain-containing protein, partial [Agromyces mariniharenae]|nr:immune inhibitor A domain-containing protein [Agromyces mariniharenae]
LDVVVREPADWITLPKDTTAYPASDDGSWTNTMFSVFVTDAIVAAQGTIDFAGSDVVWVFYPQVAPLATRAQALNLVGLTPEGPLVRAITLPKPESDSVISSVAVHETGHTFGLPDLYDTVAPGGGSSYFGSWDPMSDSWGDGVALEAWEFAGWHVWRFGWIDDAQVRCIDPSVSVELTLDAITRRGSSVIAVIPTGDHRAVVAESRKAERYDSAVVRPGVLVYVVDTTVGSGEGPIRVGPRDGTAFPTDAGGFGDATLLPGDRYTDPVGAFTVTVTATSDTGDTVRIAPANVPTEPPSESPVQPAASGATSTLPATGTDPGVLVALSVGLLLTGLAATIRWSRRPAQTDQSTPR